MHTPVHASSVARNLLKKPSMWHVYTLHDPTNGALRYIGMSPSPELRLKDHLSKRATWRMRQWVGYLAALPELRVFGSYDTRAEALDVEAGAIRASLAAGAELLNVEHGDQPRVRVPKSVTFGHTVGKNRHSNQMLESIIEKQVKLALAGRRR